MGICISTSSYSSEIYDIEHGPENVVYYEEVKDATEGNQILCSLHSQQGSKGTNQDYGIIYQGYGMELGTFCGVFDGHGTNGHMVSKLVRNRLPSLLLNQRNDYVKYNSPSNDDRNFENWKEACVSGFRAIDKEIKFKLTENLDCTCSGTTAVIAIKQGEELVIANLGDSRAVLGTIGQNGIRAVQLTTDLKPCVPMEAERIRSCNGRVLALKDESHVQRVWLPHEDSPGLAMSRAFGDFILKNHGVISIPQITNHRLTSSDQFLVLATDGVWDVLSNNEVVSIIWAAKSEEAAAKAVVDAATAAWEHKYPTSRRDDCTVICLFLQRSLHHSTKPQTQPLT